MYGIDVERWLRMLACGCGAPRIVGGPVQMRPLGATALPGACAARAGR